MYGQFSLKDISSKMSLVSVVIPCYNAENYISDCLDSVFRQSYNDLEVIAIDNASDDQTLSVLRQYKHQKAPSLLILQEPKRGATIARNRGLFKAKGEWIQFLDADDILLERKIEHQMKLTQATEDLTFIVGNYIKYMLDGREVPVVQKILDVWIALPNCTLGITSSNLFRREPLLEVGGWNESLKSSQEYELMYRLLQNNTRICFDSSLLTIKKELKTSISHSDILGNNIRRLELLRRIRRHMQAHQFTDLYIDNIQQVEFEEIRRIYRVDRKIAVTEYTQSFPSRLKITPSSSTSRLYIITYNLMGFRLAQMVNNLYQSWIKPMLKRFSKFS